jgi:26S proteasome regulatory subunit N7
VSSQRELLAECQRLMEAAGDWDRRNRLKVYEAIYLINIRDIRKVSTY